ncbi:MAG: ABC transporter substrate-binding protein [Gemmatimonadaceae bacterium]
MADIQHRPSSLEAGLAILAILVVLGAGACDRRVADPRPVVTISGSAVGDEGAIVRRQIARFMASNPGVRIELRQTPDDASQRRQLYVQWLVARADDPDVLQLDVVWTPEFAAAGWLLPLDRFAPDTTAFFPATITANRWAGRLYAIPWFVDVGLLYRRTDLVPDPPANLEELAALAHAATGGPGGPHAGWVWQGARYEGLVTVYLEILTAFGGRIMDDAGRVVVDDPRGVRALTFMRDAIGGGLSPRDVLTWHEEETRFAFQNGDAVFMRNWPYAAALLADSTQSRVAGRVAASSIPAATGGSPASALGGAQLAVNAHSDVPELAWRLVAYLTAPARMLERARMVGQLPPRQALYDDPRLAAALPLGVREAREAVASAVPRPVTPLWSELSERLQIALHSALAGQAEPTAALHRAAADMNALLERSGLQGGPATGARNPRDTP